MVIIIVIIVSMNMIIIIMSMIIIIMSIIFITQKSVFTEQVRRMFGLEEKMASTLARLARRSIAKRGQSETGARWRRQ